MTWDIDISIGPVQGFVAQSRRTRDLWGSSYLLSYLAAHARCVAPPLEARLCGREVDDDPLFRWVSGGRTGPPRIGSVPNHFVVQSDVDPERGRRGGDRDVPGRVAAGLPGGVGPLPPARLPSRSGDGADLAPPGRGVLGDRVGRGGRGSADGLLARRKHWRTHRLPDEPGDKCTVMPDFQELSGHVRAGRGRQAQRRFWDAIRTRVGTLELKEEETLCALAFIKRFFPKISKKTISGELDVDHWPSTLYVGAVPWLREVRDRAGAEAKEYVEALRQVAVEGTIRRRVPLAEFDGAEPGEFFRLDANYYHRGFLASERRAPLTGDDDSAPEQSSSTCCGRSTSLRAPRLRSTTRSCSPTATNSASRSPKQAVPRKVSEALSTFGKRVDELVQKHHGVTVYAGGDDVLAMLPVPSALPCADELAKAYTAAFTRPGLADGDSVRRGGLRPRADAGRPGARPRARPLGERGQGRQQPRLARRGSPQTRRHSLPVGDDLDPALPGWPRGARRRAAQRASRNDARQRRWARVLRLATAPHPRDADPAVRPAGLVAGSSR